MQAYQLRALFNKNLTLYWRQRIALFFICLFPIVLIAFVAILQVIITDFTVSNAENDLINPPPEPLNIFYEVNQTTLNEDYFFNYFFAAQEGCASNSLFCMGYLTQTGNASQLLGFIPQYNHTFQNGTTVLVPYFDLRSSQTAIENELNLDLIYLNSQIQNYNDNMTLQYLLPDGVVVFKNISIGFDMTTMRPWAYLNYALLVNDYSLYERLPTSIVQFRLMSFIHTAIDIPLGAGQPPLVILLQVMPFYNNQAEVRVVDVAGIALFPFAVSFLLPTYLYRLVLEKQSKLRVMMRIMGLYDSTYWFVNYVLDFALYVVVAVLFVAIEIITRVKFFVETSPLILFWMFFLWGTTQVSLAYFLSTLIRRTRTATVVGYMIVIVSVITAEILVSNIYQQERPPWLFWFYPWFVFYRAVYVIWTECYGSLSTSSSVNYWACPTTLDPNSELALAIILLAVHSVVFLLLALYLDAVLPTKGFGVPPASPLLCFSRRCRCKKRRKDQHRTAPAVDDIESGEGDDAFDESVRDERTRILGGEDNQNAAIRIVNLCKKFSSSKINKKRSPGQQRRRFAVSHLYLQIAKGECFGLLGENGAGKTTTISMLIGLLTPTHGTAYIEGYNIREPREMRQIHKLIGICPQFDTLWPTLTPEEHLLFFTRLRGTIPRSREQEHVRELLAMLELDGKRRKQLAKTLSGGMRRRLSVGIALAGDSKVVFLDEPSTGLDPRSRRLLWDIILKFRQTGQRTIVLTTHSMDEADVLCTRIGIMAKGKLRCVGTSLHLKRKFGFGYRLSITFDKKKKEEVLQFMKNILPTAVQREAQEYTTSLTYQLSEQDMLHAVDIIQQLEQAKERQFIHDWELNQTSLEDVFLNVISGTN
jgi:ABC-type multidrug transport system ATPase subunit